MMIPPIGYTGNDPKGPRVIGPSRSEAILAYRAWSIRCDENGHPHLESCSVAGVDNWRPGINTGQHAKLPLDHQVPSWACLCGYWAVHELADVDQALSRSGLLQVAGHVLGSVYLTGRIIRHEQGYRAQYAQVAGLLVPKNATEQRLQHLQQIALDYGVPLVTDPKYLGG